MGLVFGSTPIWAAGPIVVTTTADLIANDGLCALREAVIAANTDSAFSDCPAGNGADTIVFDDALPTPSLFALTLTGSDENSAQTGDLDLSGTLIISGTGSGQANDAPTIIIDGNNSDRVFHLANGANVTLIGVTIRHGKLGTTANGGGILTELGARLTITNSAIISNSAMSGGGIYGVGRVTLYNTLVAGNTGGGLTNVGGLFTLHGTQVRDNYGGYGVQNQNTGALTMNGGAVSGNQSGGIHNSGATTTLEHVTISGNLGSGVVNTGMSLTRLTVTASTILSNTAISGGALLNEGIGASAAIYDSHISGNRATSNGGALFNNGVLTVHRSTLDHNQARAGAGLHHFGGNLSLLNDTISQNRADDNGGGLYVGGSAVLNAVTLVQNQAGGDGGNLFLDEASLSIGNSIVAQAQAGGNCVSSNGFLTSLGHNLENTNSCNFAAAGDLPNHDPLLGPLQQNGGSTPTHALLAGSPAIDGGGGACPIDDQRGVSRPQGAACDIGAYEFAAATDLAIAASVVPVTITAGSRLTYTLTISNLGPLTATALVLTDEIPTATSGLTATITGGLCTPAIPLTCAVAQLTPGQALTATVAFTAPLTSGLITNTVQITAATADRFPDNNRVTFIMLITPLPDRTPPDPVTNLTTTAVTTRGATLNWDTARDDRVVAGYLIYAQKREAVTQANDNAPPPLLVGQVDSATTSYTVKTLLPQTSYQLWVVAYDGAGNVTPLAAATPVTITTLALSVGVVQISIEPPLPNDHDPISITISGIYTSSCTPHYQSHQRVEHLITITSAPSTEPFCLPAEFAWGYTVGVPPVPAGPYTVTHSLDAAVAQFHFTVTATEGPSAPIFYGDDNPPPRAVVGEPLHFVLRAGGSPAPTYALVQAPAGMTVDPTTGELVWTPPAGMVGAVAVTVRATNSVGSVDYAFTIQVAATNPSATEIFLPLIAKSS